MTYRSVIIMAALPPATGREEHKVALMFDYSATCRKIERISVLEPGRILQRRFCRIAALSILIGGVIAGRRQRTIATGAVLQFVVYEIKKPNASAL